MENRTSRMAGIINTLKPVVRLKTKTNGETFAKAITLILANIEVARRANEAGNWPAIYLSLGGVGIGLITAFWKGLTLDQSSKNQIPTSEVADLTTEIQVTQTSDKKKPHTRKLFEGLSEEEIDEIKKHYGGRTMFRNKKKKDSKK